MTSPEYYEMHITLKPVHKEAAEKIAEKYKFKTSLIAGDQVLGDEIYLYLTGKDVDEMNMFFRMDAAFSELKQLGIHVIRKKIEHILYDERF